MGGMFSGAPGGGGGLIRPSPIPASAPTEQELLRGGGKHYQLNTDFMYYYWQDFRSVNKVGFTWLEDVFEPIYRPDRMFGYPRLISTNLIMF